MSRRLTPIVLLLALSTLGATQAPTTIAAPQPLTVHEWGTFTSVAGEDGRAVDWLPLNGPPDLPRFVDRADFNIKGSLPGKVRMETPVLYFYAAHDTTVTVHVRFQQGVVTEWFPRAAVTPAFVNGSSLRHAGFAGGISWTDVKVSPGARAEFPLDSTESHYYLARQTDASPLQSGPDKERFLFYRGVGGFEPPISATVAADGSIVVRNPSGESVGDVILFENRGGRMTYQVRHAVSGQLTLNPPAFDVEFVPPQDDLERILVAHGLYAKEARAMVDTWRDSWFEEGTRLFYVVSRTAIDAILPLEIDPSPTSVARVFIGRVELVTSTTVHDVERALARNDRLTLAKYGRFLQPIVDRIRANKASS
jgi:hypothetical protein